MKKLLLLILLLAGCVSESSIPLSKDVVEINISAAPIYGRAGAAKIAITNAAKATLESGYDKFIVLNNNSWNEAGFSAAGHSSYNTYEGGGSVFASSSRLPEARMIIKMFHYDDKSSESTSAIDARKILEKARQASPALESAYPHLNRS